MTRNADHVKNLLLALCLVAASGLGPAHAARPWSEIVREMESARNNISQAHGAISKAELAVQAALDKVQTAEHFEGPQWVTLDQAMADYAQTFSTQVKVIDSNVKSLLRVNPSADLPALDFSPPQFKASVKGMEAVRDDLRRAVLRARRFKADRQQDRAKVALQMEQRIEEQYTDVALNLAGIPIGSDGSINYGDIIAGLLPGPAGLINTGLSLTFGLYYFADEMKSGVRQIKTFADQIAYADQAIAAIEANARSAEQGLQFLNGYWLKKEEAMKEFYAARNGWTGAASQSRQELKKEETSEFQKELDQPHYAASNGNFDPPILASEAEPEAKGVIKELESAALAAMQGGDPDNYAALVASRMADYRGRMDAATAVLKREDATANAAAVVMRAELDAAARAYYAAIWGHCNCERAFLDAAEAAHNAASAAAWARYAPFMAAVRKADRELNRLRMVAWMISNGADALHRQIFLYGHAANAGLQQEFNQSRNTFTEVAGDFWSLGSMLPDPYAVDGINRYVTGLDERIAGSLSRGADPAGLRSELLAYAETVRALGQRARSTVPEYRRAALAARQASKELTTNLKSNLDKDAMLIASVWDGSLGRMAQSIWDAPWSRGSDGRKEAIAKFKASVDPSFGVGEREDLDKIAAFNYDGAAAQIEEKANALGPLSDSIVAFNFRLLSATGRLDRVSRSLTGQGSFASRPKPAQLLAGDELLGGPWAAIAAALETFQAQPYAQSVRAVASRYSPSIVTQIGVRGKLMAAQVALYVAAQVQMRDYVSARNMGGFQPVRPDDFKALETYWADLKALHGQFDALAAVERLPLLAAQKDFPDSAALLKAYQAIPVTSRPLVDGAYQRYRGAAVYLTDYIVTKLPALDPLGDIARNDVAGRLTDWIGAYPQALSNWERQQAAAQAQFERQMAAQKEEERKRAEAAEKARREQEEAQKLAAQAGTESVRKLYQDFATTYQARNLRGVLRFMTPDWRAADGSDLRDLEDILDNSFRVFNSIVFAISGLTVTPAGDGRYSVGYSATITGRINQMNLNHQETAQVEDTVILTPSGPKIQATRGGRIWLKR